MCYKKLLVVEFLKTSDHYKLKTVDHLEGFYEIRCKKNWWCGYLNQIISGRLGS